MEGPNYFREALEYFKRDMSSKNGGRLLETMLRVANAPKFALPPGGKILDNDLKCLPDRIRLPYPVVVIEYYHKEDYLKEMAEAAAKHHIDDPILELMTAGHCYRDKVIVVASQWQDGPIEITVINRVADKKIWAVTPFTTKMPSERGEMVEALTTGKLPVNLVTELSLSKAWFEKLAAASMRGPVTALCELVEALSFSNISTVEIPAKKMTFTEKRKKALPYDSYHVVVVNKSEKIVGAGRSEAVGQDSSRKKREHTRRGHDRTYKRSGIKLWINPIVVNPGMGGKIVKDYIVK